MILTGRIERYVLVRTLKALGVATAIFAAVVLLIDFVDVSREVGTRTDVSFLQMIGLTLLRAPATILLLTPFVFLFGTLGAFVGLNRRSELVAMRAAGVSAWRFILPAAAAAFMIGVLTVTTLNPGAALLAGKFEDIRSQLMDNYLNTAPKPNWLRQGDADTQVVIRARSRGREDGAMTLRGVSLFIYSRDREGVMRFTRRVEAERAQLMPGYWQLNGVREATPGAGSIRSESLTIPSSLDPAQAALRFGTPQAVAFWRLPQTILETRRAGFSTTPYELRLHQLLATPLLFAAMSVLAAAFSLRLMRLGGLAGLAGSGVALGFAFFFFNEVCGAMGRAGIIPPFAAAWTPPALALLAGVILLSYTEDG